MLKPKKKLTRREIKQDKLVTTYFKVYDRIYESRRAVFTVIGIIALVLVIYLLYTNNLRSENQQAMTQLGRVFPLYDEGDYAKAISGIPERNIFGLEDIVRNYGGTETGNLASFYLANSYYHLGDNDKSYEYFDRFRSRDPLLRASALAGKAAIHETRGEHSQAAELFEQAALRFGKTAITPENLKHAGRNYFQAGSATKAIEVLEKLKEEYPESAHARDVDLLLAQISVTR